ncbi:hypothetical protein HOB10_04015 [Candidatus Parcubacteria bacterium]|jgi:hypothetical protein|nr:hypothetical protein [Candidatus Parcubacteria bacterium]
MIVLSADIKKSFRESFEVRGYTVEFKDDHVLVTKDGKPEKITNKKVMQYIEAFSPED